MLNKSEISTLKLSPTNKDFVQIWNELLEIAGKLSERWDPTSTNESDPGIVILKALTGIADKLNYNIDKNTLEAFMPTAAQEDSMRKLCDMLGYNIKYYRSAQTTATIRWYNADPTPEELTEMADPGILIPKFTVLHNSDQDINYFTLEQRNLSTSNRTVTVPCMEGQIVRCESANGDFIIGVNQISETNRYYINETQIAENGIFIYNVFNLDYAGFNEQVDGLRWEQVDNLNIQIPGSRVFKFGYDSYLDSPYIEFPEDYSELFNEGIYIYYTRTSGINGNISPGTLTQIEIPDLSSNISKDSFSVANVQAATTGSNIESIEQAYNNFKKTIGTFETLVTCRDYMNKIYLMTNDSGKPYISNVLVTDIRNDINGAITICSCDESGILYKELPVISTKSTTATTKVNKPVFDDVNKVWRIDSLNNMVLSRENLFRDTELLNNFNINQGCTAGKTVFDDNGYWSIPQDGTNFKTILPTTTTVIVESQEPSMDHFDLVVYPFKSYSQIKKGIAYDDSYIHSNFNSSFEYTKENLDEIKTKLANNKIVAHKIKSPDLGQLLNINNYLRLNAIVATTNKLTTEECNQVKYNIKVALANAFNLRELDFGEEIPFDSILEVMEKADPRIKFISLDEPALYTTFSVLEKFDELGNPKICEYAVGSKWLTSKVIADKLGQDSSTISDNNSTKESGDFSFNSEKAKKIFNELALRNVLAGRVPLFNYTKTFKSNFKESPYRITIDIKESDLPKELQPTDQNTTSSGGEILNTPAHNQFTPTEENPFTIYTDPLNNIIYTGYFHKGEKDGKILTEITYKKTYIPEDLQNIFNNSFESNSNSSSVSNNIANSGTTSLDMSTEPAATANSRTSANNNTVSNINGEAITNIKTACTVKTDRGNVSNIKLAGGETIKFRAPNFKTTKTYPAYVNYNLDLSQNTELTSHASAALCESLFNVLDKDRASWTVDNPKIRWQQVLDYFDKKGLKETFTYQQKVSALVSETLSETETSDEDKLSLKIENPIYINNKHSAQWYFENSYCVKLVNSDFKAKLDWSPSDGQEVPVDTAFDIEIILSKWNNPFVLEYSTLQKVEEAINDAIMSLRDEEASKLPTTCDWTISFDFECVPFNRETFVAWEKFVQDERNNVSLFGFKPIEGETILWRLFDGEYQVGRAVTENHQKLLSLGLNDLGLLPATDLMRNVYLVESLGSDTQAKYIKNDEEYELKANEYLYLEYTPSTPTEKSTETSAPKTEIYGPGTIIRPKGFEVGLTDSAVHRAAGNSPHKTVDFIQEQGQPITKELFSLGSNEQIEVRELAQTVLESKTFESNEVFVYKSFNDCEALENSKASNRTYILKDGEYIFYTDRSKTDFAYYTSGTEVSLAGDIAIPKCPLIELASIQEDGIEVIPWQRLSLNNGAKIIFQECQYLTLGDEDELIELELVGGEDDVDDTWKFCNSAIYAFANSPSDSIVLSPICLSTRPGNGWEVSSSLELKSSPENEQTLRSTDKIQTKLTLATGGSDNSSRHEIVIQPQEGHPLSFKTNVVCASNTGDFNFKTVSSIGTILNPNDEKSFKFKIFAKDEPTVVKTAPGQTIPDPTSSVEDILNWTGTSLLTENRLDSWTTVNLEDIKVSAPGKNFDNALALPINLLPNSYGVTCFYLSYTSLESQLNAKTWIEVPHGYNINPESGSSSELNLALELSNADVILMNDSSPTYSEASGLSSAKLFLKPGINCVRFNKSGKFYIKTSENSNGSLFFDELKCVNFETVTYSNSNGVPITLMTQGLNYKQLGYLSLVDSTITDENSMKSLKKLYADKTLLEIDSKADEATNELINAKTDIVKKYFDYTKTVVSYEKKILKELQKVAELKPEQYQDLLNAFTKLYGTLTLNKQLKKAIEDNKLTSDLENKVIELANKSVNSFYLDKQALRESFESFIITVLSSVSELTESEIFAAFNQACAVSSNPVDLNPKEEEIYDKLITTNNEHLKEMIPSIKSLTEQKIEKDFLNQLKSAVDSLNKITNDETRNQLKTYLLQLQNLHQSDFYAKLLLLVNRLKEILNQDAIMANLVAIITGVGQEDKVSVLTNLAQLKSKFQNRDLNVVLSELEATLTNSESSTELRPLVEELQAIFSGCINSVLISAVDDAYNKVLRKGFATGGLTTSGAKDLYNNVLNNYTNQANEIFQEIIQTVNKLFPTDSFIAKEASTYNSNIKELAESIDILIDKLLGKFSADKEKISSDVSIAENYLATEIEFNGSTLKLKEYLELIQDKYYNAPDEVKAFVFGYSALEDVETCYLTAYTLSNLTNQYKTAKERAHHLISLALIAAPAISNPNILATDYRVGLAIREANILLELLNSTKIMWGAEENYSIFENIIKVFYSQSTSNAIELVQNAYNEYEKYTTNRQEQLGALKVNLSLEEVEDNTDLARLRILNYISNCLREVDLAEDNQVVESLNLFESIFNSRRLKLLSIQNLRESRVTTQINASTTFGKSLSNLLQSADLMEVKSLIDESIVQLWPDFIKKQLLVFINIFETPVQDTISLNLLDNDQADDKLSLYLDYEKYSNFLPEILRFLVNVDLFKQFNNKLNSHVLYYNKHHDQNDTLELLTKASVITTSRSLQEKLNEESISNYSSTSSIAALLSSLAELNEKITDGGNVSIISAQQQKHQIINALTEELNTVITQDTELLKMLLEAVCPDTLNIYETLRNELNLEIQNKDKKVNEERQFSYLYFFIEEFIKLLSTKTKFEDMKIYINKFDTSCDNDKAVFKFLEKLNGLPVREQLPDFASVEEVLNSDIESALDLEKNRLGLDETKYSVENETFISYFSLKEVEDDLKDAGDKVLSSVIKDNIVSYDFIEVRDSLLKIIKKQLKTESFKAIKGKTIIDSSTDNSIKLLEDTSKNGTDQLEKFIKNIYYAKIDLDPVNISDDFNNVLYHIIDQLIREWKNLDSGTFNVDQASRTVFDTIFLEDQLLKDIRRVDINRDFYYSVPIENSLAINFNENDSSLNTLMNPQIFYDVNNVNNSFVMSKLDISFLSEGIQIARSSKLN